MSLSKIYFIHPMQLYKQLPSITKHYCRDSNIDPSLEIISYIGNFHTLEIKRIPEILASLQELQASSLAYIVIL